MIRTALAIVLVAATASLAHANVPTPAQVTVMPHSTASADCARADSTAQHAACQDHQLQVISRGHADLDRRLQLPAQADTIATA